MKKAAIIFLVFVYGFSTSGVALKADYCCEKLKSLKLVLAQDGKDQNGCCKIKYQFFKVKDTHAAADSLTAPALHLTFLHLPGTSLQAANQAYEPGRFVNIHAPPLFPSTPVYISNCVFRI